MGDFDVMVMGGGLPGEHCARALAEGGLRVAVVESELVGGECSTTRASRRRHCSDPARPCTRPGTRWRLPEVDVEAAFAWRDFMVSDYSDAGQERWLADNDITLLRGTGVVDVDGTQHTADHVVLANGAERVNPRSLDPSTRSGSRP